MQRVAEAPLLPANLLAADGEARAVRLRDRQALGRRPEPCRFLVELLAWRRCRYDAAIRDLEHLAGANVDQRDHAFDWPAIEIRLAVDEIGDAAHQPAGILSGRHLAHRPPVDL